MSDTPHHEPGSGDAEAPGVRRCVYTVLTGGYEQLNEQPTAAESGIPFICLTDDPELTSNSWEIRVMEPAHPGDPVRSQRVAKARAHAYLPEFDASLYIDNVVVLRAPPEQVFARYFAPGGFVVPLHPAQDTVLDEFAVIAAVGMDDPEVIFEQLDEYMTRCPEALDERCTMSCVLIRDHRAPAVRLAGDVWAEEMERHSRRDQLSLNVSLHEADLRPQVLGVDARGSWFHSWPHQTRRRQLRPIVGAPSVPLLLAKRIMKLTRQHTGEPEQPSSRTRGDCSVTASGIHVDPNDLRGQQLVRTGSPLVPTTYAIWRDLLFSAGWTHVVDVGANYGEMLVDLDLPPSVVVTAVEPSPRVRMFLERTLAETGRDVHVESRALDERSGRARLLIDPIWSGRTRLLRADEPPPAGGLLIRVETTTLSELLGGADTAPAVRALVKIDVEGGEAGVLRGAAGVLDRLDGFTALVEIDHLSADEREWLLDHFRVQVYAPGDTSFVDVAPPTRDRLTQMLADRRYWGMDVVVRRLQDGDI